MSERTPPTLIGALALTVLSLGLDWIGSISGHVLNTRVLVVGAIALLALAVTKRAAAPATSINALSGAALCLSATLALTVQGIEPAALMVVSLALVLILVGRRQLRTA